MKPKQTLILFIGIMLLILITCFNCEKSKAQNSKEEITAIENNLLPPILVSNEPSKKFNLLERMEYHNILGISMAVVKNGKLHWAKGFGKRNTNKNVL